MQLPSKQIEDLTEAQLTIAVACCKTADAVFDSFCCDRYRYIINGALPCPAHQSSGARLAAQLRDTVSDCGIHDKFPGVRRLAISVAACSGPAQCGDVGCDDVRRYDVRGGGATGAHSYRARALPQCASPTHSVPLKGSVRLGCASPRRAWDRLWSAAAPSLHPRAPTDREAMQKARAAALLTLPVAASAWKACSIADHNATGDGKTYSMEQRPGWFPDSILYDTDAVDAALKECAGGGVVIVPAGKTYDEISRPNMRNVDRDSSLYLSAGGHVLGTNMALEVQGGATLQLTADTSKQPGNMMFISAANASNVSIYGGGSLTGPGATSTCWNYGGKQYATMLEFDNIKTLRILPRCIDSTQLFETEWCALNHPEKNSFGTHSKVLRTWVEPQFGCAANLPSIHSGTALGGQMAKTLTGVHPWAAVDGADMGAGMDPPGN
eukprot:gene32128-biopygen66550